MEFYRVVGLGVAAGYPLEDCLEQAASARRVDQRTLTELLDSAEAEGLDVLRAPEFSGGRSEDCRANRLVNTIDEIIWEAEA